MISATRIRLTSTKTTKCRSIITITTNSQNSSSSCKAVADMNITRQKGGKIINNILPKNRFFTTTKTTTTATATHRHHSLAVVSRRNWKEYELKHILPTKPKIKPKGNNVGGDEKPWPRNVRIAGYVVAAIFIPYSTVWLITSNPTWRYYFGPYLPLDRLRKHFGDKEWDVQSYPEMMESNKSSQQQQQQQEENLPNGYYQFPLEESYQDRKQQTIIEEFDLKEIVANLYYVGNNNNNNNQQQTTITKEVPASARANLTSLSELMGIGTTNPNNKLSIEGNIYVDFINEDENNVHDTSLSNSNTTTDADNTTTTTTFGDDILLTVYDDSVSSSKPSNNGLLQTMFSYSSWHHVPNTQGGGGGGGQQVDDDNGKSQQQKSTAILNNVDLEISKLEYIIDELSSNLKDPLCTRDIDDMTNELNQSKKELRRLKWKRRLGW